MIKTKHHRLKIVSTSSRDLTKPITTPMCDMTKVYCGRAGGIIVTDRENIEIIRTKIEPKLDEIKNELNSIVDPETLEEVEKVRRELSTISTEDLLRPFTI